MMAWQVRCCSMIRALSELVWREIALDGICYYYGVREYDKWLDVQPANPPLLLSRTCLDTTPTLVAEHWTTSPPRPTDGTGGRHFPFPPSGCRRPPCRGRVSSSRAWPAGWASYCSLGDTGENSAGYLCIYVTYRVAPVGQNVKNVDMAQLLTCEAPDMKQATRTSPKPRRPHRHHSGCRALDVRWYRDGLMSIIRQ